MPLVYGLPDDPEFSKLFEYGGIFDYGYHHPHFDGKAAYDALRKVLDCVFTCRNEEKANIDDLDLQDLGDVPAEVKDMIVDQHVDQCHSFEYQHVACCHAAVGSLAPCFEGLFLHEFATLRSDFGDSTSVNEHPRWELSSDDFWNPKVVCEKGVKRDRDDITRGVKQLITSLELADYFPDATHNKLDALFRYRNYALHQGYEWPPESRQKFSTLIHQKNWAEWFEWSTCGDERWMCYSTDAFVAVCLDLFDQLLDSFHKIHMTWRK